MRHTDNKTDKPGNIFKQMNKERGLGEVVTEVSGPVINIPDANIMDTYPPVMSDSQFQSLINNNSVQVTSAPSAPMEFKPESSHQPEQRISITPEIDSDEAFSDIIEGTDYMTILTTSCSENTPSAFVFTPAQQAGMNNSIHTHSTVMDINSHQQMEAKPTVMDINLPQQMEAKVDWEHPQPEGIPVPSQVINTGLAQPVINAISVQNMSASPVNAGLSTGNSATPPPANKGKPQIKMVFYEFDFSPLPGQIFQINESGELELVKFTPGKLYQADYCNSLMEIDLPINKWANP